MRAKVLDPKFVRSRVCLSSVSLSSRGKTPAGTVPRIASSPLVIFFVSRIVIDWAVLLSPKRLELVTGSLIRLRIFCGAQDYSIFLRSS
jgi:hypothetical protein